MGCTSILKEKNDSYSLYESVYFGYSQFEKEIYIQVQINESFINEVDSINVIIYEIVGQADDLIIAKLMLSDDGFSSGDLILSNGVYTFLGDLELNYTKHLIHYKIYNHDTVHDFFEIKSVIEFTEPSIVDVEFYKTTINNQMIKLEDNYYSVNELDSSYLKFRVEIESLSGIEQINKIIYSIQINETEATKCGNSLPSYNYFADEFILQYDYSIGTSYFFTNINTVIEEPGMVIASELGYTDDNGNEHCGIIGLVNFSITIIDENFGNINSSFPINFTSCGSGFWDCTNEYSDCEIECD